MKTGRILWAAAAMCFAAANVMAQGPAGDGWAAISARWRAVKATADLETAVSTIQAPASSSAGVLLSWYVDRGWEVDRAHRRLEIA